MTSLLYAVLAAAGNLVGALAITARPRWSPRTLELFLAFSAGFLVAVSLTGILPEALTQAGDAKVRVSKCNGGICGVVVWLRDPIDPATGKPQVDDKNHNPSLAKRPVIGLPLRSTTVAGVVA